MEKMLMFANRLCGITDGLSVTEPVLNIERTRSLERGSPLMDSLVFRNVVSDREMVSSGFQNTPSPSAETHWLRVAALLRFVRHRP